jgi:protein-disulfide isomerase
MSRTRPVVKKQAKAAVSPVMIAAVVVGALLLVGGLILLGNQGRNTETGSLGSLDLSRYPALGDPNAPVTIVEFSDYG